MTIDLLSPVATRLSRRVSVRLSGPYFGKSAPSTLTHPARSSGAASASGISIVPSGATFRRSPERSWTCPTPAGGGAAPGSPTSLPPSLFLGEHPVIAEEPRLAAALLEPLEHLRGGIDLVVVAAVGEDRQLVQVEREPRRRVRQVDKAVLD